MFRISLLIIITCLISINTLPGQTKGINRQAYRIHNTKTDSTIKIDGILNESIWRFADKVDKFHRVLPTDTGYAIARTEVRIAYSESAIYFGIICFDPSSGKRPVESLRRDFSFMKNDNFIVFIDTYNDYTNGFAFGVSPAGAQWDGIQSNGGTVNLDWDIKWRSEVKNFEDRWIAEFAIPFRSLRYKEESPEWGINFSRHDLKLNEKSSWAPMPRQFATATLAFTGSLVWDKPPPSSDLRFSLIPYFTVKTKQDRNVGEGFKKDAGAGFDAKVILSTSMNLDLTVNPDYSQVEVDRQIVNLDRFELLFPEKRQFYLENSDLFAKLGSDNVRPFFSRRIGLDNPVQAGARLSGKIGKNWRIGLMNLQTGKQDTTEAGNFTVGALQRQIFSHSNVAVFIVNKMVTGSIDDSYKGNNFNRIAGIEYNLASADNHWLGKVFYHKAFYPGASNNADAAAASLTYSTQYFTASFNQALVGADYLAETGYVKRNGYYQVNPSFQYKFFPAGSRIANHGPVIKFDILFDPKMILSDRETQLLYQVEWSNRSIFQFDVKETFIRLQEPFDPTKSGTNFLQVNEKFSGKEIGSAFTSDIRRQFNFNIGTRYGGFYNGEKLTVNGELYYRVQPYGSLTIISSYNKLIMPEPFKNTNFILVGPKVDLTFTDKLFLTTFVQYNNQINNLNLNLRFQWRFAPVSDLFIVYTENSFPSNFVIKNRGLVLKMSYWFN